MRKCSSCLLGEYKVDTATPRTSVLVSSNLRKTHYVKQCHAWEEEQKTGREGKLLNGM